MGKSVVILPDGLCKAILVKDSELIHGSLPVQMIRPNLQAVAPLLVEKLRTYVELFNEMERNGGWLCYSESVLDYFRELGVRHWAELYSKDGQDRWRKGHQLQIDELHKSVADEIGESPTPERANAFLNEIGSYFSSDECELAAIPGFEFMECDPHQVDASNFTEEERYLQRDVLIAHHVGFYNDLALASHGETIFSLVARAIEQKDDDALVKAIQIDRSLLSYFQEQIWDRSMAGNSGFWDSFAYRANNPPLRGKNTHPLLWVLFKDLHSIRCLDRSITGKQILKLYAEGIGEHPRFVIDDELTVQRQRRKFMKMYRQPK